MNTNWSSPYKNYFSALVSLSRALSSGYNAVLVKMWNEETAFPIKETPKNKISDYKSTGSYYMSKTEILNSNATDYVKYLKLNYTDAFGTKEAIETYEKTGKLSKDNFRGMGICHLVKITDKIDFYKSINDIEMVKYWESHIVERNNDKKILTTNIRLKSYDLPPKKFKHKLWVVVMLNKDEKFKIPFIVKLLNVVYYPLKFIPQRRILKMDNYNTYLFRIGSVSNGYSIEIQIPKKFSFKEDKD